MKKTAMVLSVFSLLLLAISGGNTGAYVLDHTVTDIDGNQVNLESYKGKVLLIVNVASKCGLTPQYEDLVALDEQYGDQGLVILGFPANNFRNQEPGTDAEIKEFCSLNYGVSFPMFSKVSVLGEDIAPLYEELTSSEANPEYAGDIAWNFTKFLVGRDGYVQARFEPQTSPTAVEVTSAIEAMLAQ